MVALDSVVRVLLGVVNRRSDQSCDRRPQSRSSVGHDLDRVTVQMQRGREEPSRGSEIASC
jgi:hypothetical protein